ncbi:hypothetical protein ACI2K4_02325 [Micromonospora sp. NPDC050397]|uniref:hypothetical protein n=1 Tax=Micromonospora sp. NPDC050397 TaxID=3364279 RepID=UPI00385061BC
MRGQALEQMLTGAMIHDSNPFGEQPEGDPANTPRAAVDVSSDAMTRLRTPFEVTTETTRPRDDHDQRR